MTPKTFLIAVALFFYLAGAILSFGEAMHHFKDDPVKNNDVRWIPATIVSVAWPLYVSYRVFDEEPSNESGKAITP